MEWCCRFPLSCECKECHSSPRLCQVFTPFEKQAPTQPPEKNGSIMENKLMSISINFNPSKVWYRPWKVTFKKSYLQNRKVVFQPSFFRGELLNFVRVPLKASHSCLWNHATNSYVFQDLKYLQIRNPLNFWFVKHAHNIAFWKENMF